MESDQKSRKETCKKVLGKSGRQHKESISINTLEKLDKRKTENRCLINKSRTSTSRSKAKEAYTDADREVKRKIKKRKYVDRLAREAEKGNIKDSYMIIRKLSGILHQTENLVKDKDGHPITTTE
jgi:hypothetical protein